jgi:hypothetical protein
MRSLRKKADWLRTWRIFPKKPLRRHQRCRHWDKPLCVNILCGHALLFCTRQMCHVTSRKNCQNETQISPFSFGKFFKTFFNIGTTSAISFFFLKFYRRENFNIYFWRFLNFLRNVSIEFFFEGKNHYTSIILCKVLKKFTEGNF